jgi:nucleotide-binding universal stress UspA family protein
MPETVFHRIVVPTDFSTCSELAWRMARRLAAAAGGELILAHVLVETPLFAEGSVGMGQARDVYAAAEQWAQQTIERWAGTARAEGLTVRVALRTGVPHEEIVALAIDERADLVVLGTHGRGGLSRALLGSVADRVIRIAPCPVLSVRESA